MTRHKILLVDDDPSVLDTYKGLLEHIPSRPVILTASSGSRAIAMLEAQDIKMLVCDLKMPRMDGLQVLSIVRRKFPMVRTVALTGVADEHFRSRVYSIGVDLYWHKPNTTQEITQFLECCESLLGSEDGSGFRGVQSKSLMDIIQLECMSQSSSVLRINNGATTGRIWIQDGEVIHAETEELKGEQAFLKIFSWSTGSFEIQPCQPNRTRTIHKPYNSLLLESAQALDESRGKTEAREEKNPLAGLAQIEGIEFVLAIKTDDAKPTFARGLENPDGMAEWTRRFVRSFEELGERMHTGKLSQIDGLGPQRQLTAVRRNGTQFCIGWKNTLEREQAHEAVKKVLELWAS